MLLAINTPNETETSIADSFETIGAQYRKGALNALEVSLDLQDVIKYWAYISNSTPVDMVPAEYLPLRFNISLVPVGSQTGASEKTSEKTIEYNPLNGSDILRVTFEHLPILVKYLLKVCMFWLDVL